MQLSVETCFADGGENLTYLGRTQDANGSAANESEAPLAAGRRDFCIGQQERVEDGMGAQARTRKGEGEGESEVPSR